MVNFPAEKLADAAARHQIELPDAQITLLERYCEMLWQWNEKINLTRHTNYEKFVARDLVDSLVFAEFLKPGEKVLDVGSGGGVPGIVLAIVRGDLQVSLVDSVGKKAKVLNDIVQRLDLMVPVLHARAEDLLKQERYDTLVVRAVAPLKKAAPMVPAALAIVRPIVGYQRSGLGGERGEARHFGLLKNLEMRKLKTYPLPNTDSESILLQISLSERQ